MGGNRETLSIGGNCAVPSERLRALPLRDAACSHPPKVNNADKKRLTHPDANASAQWRARARVVVVSAMLFSQAP